MDDFATDAEVAVDDSIKHATVFTKFITQRASAARAPFAPESGSQTQRDESLVIQESGRLGNGLAAPALVMTRTSICGTSLSSGETVLQQTDFQLPGPMALVWRRTYRTSLNKDFGLGARWATPFFSRLLLADQKIFFADGEGRLIPFWIPEPGAACLNNVERLTLMRDNDRQYRVTGENGLTWLFKGSEKIKRLFALSRENFHIQLRYGESGRLSYIVDSAGRRLKLEYNIAKRLQSVILLDENGRPDGKPLVQYRYSNRGDLVCVVDAAGHTQNFEYRNHVITERTSKDGFHFYYKWDRHDKGGRCVHSWGERDMYHNRFEFDLENKLSRIIDGRGDVTTFHYNHLGIVTREIDADGGASEWHYNDKGRLLLARDPAGNSTHCGYDAAGRLTRYVNAIGHTTRFTYDDCGRLTGVIDAMGMRWRRNYDANGCLAGVIDPLGRAMQYRYDQPGFPTAVIDAMKRKRRLEWSDRGELLAVTDSVGNRKEYRYDPLGRVIQAQENGGITRLTYDPMGRITQVTYPDGSSFQLQYTPEGMPARHIDALGRTTQYRYDGLGRPVERINAHGQTFKYLYDADRNLTVLINENGDRYELHYDNNQRLVKEVGFDGRVQHYGYDTAGRLVSHTDGASRITQFKRDAMGQLLKKWSSDQDQSRYEYDPLGRLIYASSGEGEVEFKYSDGGQLVEERQHSVRLRHEYDLNNQRSATSFNTERIEYEYNSQGFFKRIAYNGNTIVSVTRNALGLEIARTCGAVSSFFEYDGAGRLVHQRAANESDLVMERSYHYDKWGNLRQLDDLKAGKTQFKYDALDRLQALEGPAPERFAFDPAGNLLDARQAFASARVKGNRLAIFADMRFEYDDAGNLITETKGKKQTHFFYNTQNQLIKIEKDGRVVTYSYDPLGRRVKKRDAAGETTYFWDGDVLLGEQRNNPAGAQITRTIYIHEPGSLRPLCQIRNGKVYYYHNDHLGTPQCLTDERGNVVWAARYKAYGKVSGYDAKAIGNNLRFHGQYYDPETGLHYARHRYYHPLIGRFIHQDPMGLLGSHNPYEYALNPVNRLDPLELKNARGMAHPANVPGPGSFSPMLLEWEHYPLEMYLTGAAARTATLHTTYLRNYPWLERPMTPGGSWAARLVGFEST